ncbi:MAG TPA: ROK family protein, partial [Candidatus Nanoarchaeia archaeon]|nr:ROK family protein [Candidatus Nanoarchaeia archaeon]
SQKKETLLGGPNLKDWVGKPLQSELNEFFGAPVFVENDAALVGLGEAMRGGGRGFGIVAYVTVSTGVGGAKIVNGTIDPRSVGFEPGHEIIDIDKTLVPDASGTTLESYISGAGLMNRTGKKPKEITDPKVWDDLAHILAYGLNNVAVFWSPDVIVLGGSMITGEPAISIEKTEEYLKEVLKIYPEIPKIRKAELGDLGGLHGALEYLRQQVI